MRDVYVIRNVIRNTQELKTLKQRNLAAIYPLHLETQLADTLRANTRLIFKVFYLRYSL